MTDGIETVLVAGASGGTGRQLMGGLDDTDFTVRALTSSPGKVKTLAKRGADEVVVGDLLDPADAARAVRGVDIVLSTVGSRPRDMLLAGDLVDGAGNRHLTIAAIAADVSHLVMESSIGVGTSKTAMPRTFRAVVGRLLRAKERAERTIRTSGLSYTVLRPGRLTNAGATGDVLVGEGGTSVGGKIPRADVARLMLAAPFTPAARNRTFEVVSRDGQRGRPGEVVDIDWQCPSG